MDELNSLQKDENSLGFKEIQEMTVVYIEW